MHTPGNNYLSRPLNGLKNTFRSLQYRNYRLFFGGQSISLTGTWIQRIAMPWLVYHLTGSVVLLGVVGFAGQIPTFLLASYAGVITDRRNRYHILIATQVLAMLQALTLALLYFLGIIEVWHILALSVMLGLINAFDVPARQSFVIEMVEKKKDLGNAIALNSSMVNGARLIGPSVAGVLIATTGEGVCFLINGLSYLVVIASLIGMKVTPRVIAKKSTRVMQELKEGFHYTFGFAPIKSIILLLALVSLMGMPYNVLMPVFAKEVLHGDSHTFGFLMGATGLGAITGAMYLASRKSVDGLERLIPAAAAVFGLGLIAFSQSRLFWLSMILMVLTGLGMMLTMASSNTIIQTVVDDSKRGRVMSFYAMAFMGTAPFGSLFAGAVAKVVGAPLTLAIGGAAVVAGALLFARQLPKIQETILPVYREMGIRPNKSSTQP
ncbi:MFS transporter [Prolixibacter bellariivorans]|uniref:MFS transporter n=3 Tax=Prolixibacter bellariivorans TaxID=314319 RepID=A0A5M4B0S5_9BACT|nr:MFS transporter [Prolixibacter bellariivorans]GET33664.1 MFS transporter [Prolixibacter bellariivorans]